MSWNAITELTFALKAREGGVGDLPLSDTYRQYAAECLALAQGATNDDDRARLLSMAQAWRELADKLDGAPDAARD